MAAVTKVRILVTAWTIFFLSKIIKKIVIKIASAGNRTRINCLEGSYADHYTTDALLTLVLPKAQVFQQKQLATCS